MVALIASKDGPNEETTQNMAAGGAGLQMRTLLLNSMWPASTPTASSSRGRFCASSGAGPQARSFSP